MTVFVGILQLLGLIASAVFLFCLFPWRISFNGHIVLKESHFSSNGKVTLGTSRFGFMIKPSKYISFGTFGNPWLRFSAQKKSKFETKIPKKENSKMGKKSLLKFIRPALKTFRWEVFSLTGNLGLKSPADTGIVFGGIQAVRGWIRTNRIQLDIQPVFTHKTDTDLTGSLQFSLVPVRLAWNLTKTYLHFRFQKG